MLRASDKSLGMIRLQMMDEYANLSGKFIVAYQLKQGGEAHAYKEFDSAKEQEFFFERVLPPASECHYKFYSFP